jgi:hypothetical protein
MLVEVVEVEMMLKLILAAISIEILRAVQKKSTSPRGDM